MRPEEPITYTRLNRRPTGLTLFGGIGNCLHGKVVYHIGASTNKEDYHYFLVKLKEATINHFDKPYLVFDGAPAHRSSDIMEMVR